MSINNLERDLRAEQLSESEMKNRLISMGYPSNSDPHLDYKTAIQDKFYLERLKQHLRLRQPNQTTQPYRASNKQQTSVSIDGDSQDVSFSRSTSFTGLNSSKLPLSTSTQHHVNNNNNNSRVSTHLKASQNKENAPPNSLLLPQPLSLLSKNGSVNTMQQKIRPGTLNNTQQNLSMQYFGGEHHHHNPAQPSSYLSSRPQANSGDLSNQYAVGSTLLSQQRSTIAGGEALLKRTPQLKTPKFNSNSKTEYNIEQIDEEAETLPHLVALLQKLKNNSYIQFFIKKISFNEPLQAILALIVVITVVTILALFLNNYFGSVQQQPKMAPPARGVFCANDLSRENQKALGCTPCPTNAICKSGEAYCKDAFYLLNGECNERQEVQTDAQTYAREVAEKLRMVNGEEFCASREQGYMNWKQIYNFLHELHSQENFFAQKVDRVMELLQQDLDGTRTKLQIELNNDRYFCFQRSVTLWCKIKFFFSFNWHFFRNLVYFCSILTVMALLIVKRETIQRKFQQFYGHNTAARFLLKRLVRIFFAKRRNHQVKK